MTLDAHDMVVELRQMTLDAHGRSLHMGAVEHQDTYVRMLNVASRFCCTVKCCNDDVTLIPCNPASSSSSTSTEHLYQAPSSHTRPLFSATFSAPAMYVSPSSGFYSVVCFF
jgi:hypothetical protein